VVASAVIPAAFAANANNQVNFALTEQKAKLTNLAISSASNNVRATKTQCVVLFIYTHIHRQDRINSSVDAF
jgi:hypothetical protein